MVAPYQVFPTRDGELMIAGGNDRLFAAISEVVGLPALASDPRFVTNPERVARRDELFEILVERLQQDDTATWQRRLAAAGVPVAPVADVQDVIDSPQTAGARDHAAARPSPDRWASARGAPSVAGR